MSQIMEMYRTMGIRPSVYEFGTNIEKELKESKLQGIKDRISVLTEKFKNDPTKLAILSQIAQDLQTAE